MAADVLVKNAWYVVGMSREFPTRQLQGQVVTEKPLVIWRTAEGSVVAFDDRCRHKRMPLSQGRLIDGGLLECAYHGLCYDATGRCVRRLPSRSPPPASRSPGAAATEAHAHACGPVREAPKHLPQDPRSGVFGLVLAQVLAP